MILRVPLIVPNRPDRLQRQEVNFVSVSAPKLSAALAAAEVCEQTEQDDEGRNTTVPGYESPGVGILYIGDDPVPGKQEAQHDQDRNNEATFSAWFLSGHRDLFRTAIVEEGHAIRKDSMHVEARNEIAIQPRSRSFSSLAGVVWVLSTARTSSSSLFPQVGL
jgi:hypothetical protein